MAASVRAVSPGFAALARRRDCTEGPRGCIACLRSKLTKGTARFSPFSSARPPSLSERAKRARKIFPGTAATLFPARDRPAFPNAQSGRARSFRAQRLRFLQRATAQPFRTHKAGAQDLSGHSGYNAKKRRAPVTHALSPRTGPSEATAAAQRTNDRLPHAHRPVTHRGATVGRGTPRSALRAVGASGVPLGP